MSDLDLKNQHLIVSEQQQALDVLTAQLAQYKTSVKTYETRISHLEKLLVEQHSSSDPSSSRQNQKADSKERMGLDERLENQLKETRREIEQYDQKIQGHSEVSPLTSTTSPSTGISIDLDEDARVLDAQMQIGRSNE
jgi:predicted RNase H-like nuclease (RuvC/YqgF family)